MGATWYVEHRNGRITRTWSDDPRAFASRARYLAAAGAGGEVLLIEAVTGLVLTRQALPGAAQPTGEAASAAPVPPLARRAAGQSAHPEA
jgi:hypothetical protein